MAGDMETTSHALPFKKRKVLCLDEVPAKRVCAISRIVVCACARLCGWREVSIESFQRQCRPAGALGQ